MEILNIILPAFIVFLTAYFLINKLLGNEDNRRNFELRKNSLNTVTPIRLRAYERLILVLERTTPSAMIVQLAKPGMSNMELHSQLLATIRHEFGHNISQQIYVSDDVWNFVRSAQESLLQLVNTCASKCNPQESASALAELVINAYDASEQTPTEQAITKLKGEVKQIF